MPRKKSDEEVKDVSEQKNETSPAPEETSEQKEAAETPSEKKSKETAEKTVSEEAKKESSEKSVEEKHEKILEERVYTFRLGRVYSTTRKKRAPRAVKYIKSRLERHLKKPVKISPEVNSIIWSRGAEKPVRRITVKTLIYEDRVLVVPMR
jgi:large subunit ribosomal protein L31e